VRLARRRFTARIEPFEAVELEVGRLFLPREGQGGP
jgi:hypothetical protein